MPPFLLVIAGDRRLGVAHYRFVRAKLDTLVRNRLPDVRVLCGRASGVDVLVQRWADESHVIVEPYPQGPDYPSEPGEAAFIWWAMDRHPQGVVLFDGGGQQWAELVRRAMVSEVPLRRVDVRGLLVGKG